MVKTFNLDLFRSPGVYALRSTATLDIPENADVPQNSTDVYTDCVSSSGIIRRFLLFEK